MFTLFVVFSAQSSADGNSARRDFLSYALSLMRSYNDEHADSLPVIDISALRHSAYVFDALIYYMRTSPESDGDPLKDGISVISWQDTDDNDNEENEDDAANTSVTMETESLEGGENEAGKVGRKHAFFQRSDSTIFLGCPPPDPFHTPLVEALPLADQPHLLQPNSRREDLFGMARPAIFPRSAEGQGQEGSISQKLPLNLSLSTRARDKRAELVGGLRCASYQGLHSRLRNQTAEPVSHRLDPLTSRVDPLTPRLDLSASTAAPQSAAINLSLSATGGGGGRVSDSTHFLASSPGRPAGVDVAMEETERSAAGPARGETAVVQPSGSGVIVEMSTTAQSSASLRPSGSPVEGGQRSRSPSDMSQPSVIVHTASSSLPVPQPLPGKSFCVVLVLLTHLSNW